MSGAKEGGPALDLVAEIIEQASARAAIVVVVFASDDGMLGIDVAAGDRALPAACAGYGPALQLLIASALEDLRRRIDAFSEAVPATRLNRVAPRGDA